MTPASQHENCRIVAGLVRPSVERGLVRIRSYAKEGVLHRTGPFAAGGRGLIVLGLDALSQEFMADLWSPSERFSLTSTFPSTSVLAWPSALSGKSVDELNLCGVVYFDAKANGLFHAFRDLFLPLGSWDWSAEARPASAVTLGPWDNVFSDLACVGAVARDGDLAAWPGRWADALLHGAVRRRDSQVFADIRFKPAEIVEWAVRQVSAEVDASVREPPAFVWTFVNFDDYVHARGYTSELREALRRLERSVERWVQAGYSVVCHSDHGMVPCQVAPEVWHEWEHLAGPENCRLPAGGAGRVRWIYPRKLDAASLRDLHGRLSELLKGDAMVLYRSQLADMGLLPRAICSGPAIGELVALATGPGFPVPDPSYRWEHGSATAAEMICPVAVWR